jgi:hypothetical protein
VNPNETQEKNSQQPFPKWYCVYAYTHTKKNFWGAVLWFEFRASHLQGRHSTTWATLLPHFALVILEIGSHFLPRLAWTTILLFHTIHHHWYDRYIPSHAAFLHWDAGIMNFFCLGWPWTLILQISASKIDRITGISHQCLTEKYYFNNTFAFWHNVFPRTF